MVPKSSLKESGQKNPVREDREVIIPHLGSFLSILIRRRNPIVSVCAPTHYEFNRSG